MSRTLRFISVFLVLAFGARAHAQLSSVSSGEHAWVMIETEGLRAKYQALNHLSGDLKPSLDSTEIKLPINARLLCASQNRVLYTLDPVSDPAQGRPSLTRVRETGVQPVDGPRGYLFTQQTALPHIPEGLTVLGGASFGQNAYILTTNAAETLAVFALDQAEWVPVRELSFQAAENRGRHGLLAIGNQLVVYRVTGSGLETLAFNPRTDGPIDRAVYVSIGRFSSIQSVGTRMVAVDVLGSSRKLMMLSSGGAGVELVSQVPTGTALFDLGGNVCMVWQLETGALSSHVISLSGVQIYEGPLTIRAMIEPEQLQVLGLILVSGLLSILFFIWRPLEQDSAVEFPPGNALADPSRRATAWGVDITVAVLLSALIWRTSATSVALLAPAGESGILPTLTAMGIFILHTSIAETVSGRSIGKLLARIRVVSVSGGTPSAGRAIVRNVIRGVCPTLCLSLLMGPALREPWACGTLVIMQIGDGAEPPVSDEQPPQSDPDDSSD